MICAWGNLRESATAAVRRSAPAPRDGSPQARDAETSSPPPKTTTPATEAGALKGACCPSKADKSICPTGSMPTVRVSAQTLHRLARASLSRLRKWATSAVTARTAIHASGLMRKPTTFEIMKIRVSMGS